MAIRYKCDSCGSALTIKDELAGTKGKCPKCKTPFIVPQRDEGPEHDPSPVKERSPGKIKGTAPKAAAAAAKAGPASGGVDDAGFDPVAFLMDDDSGPRTRPGGAVRAKPSTPPPSDAELPGDLLQQASGRKRRPRSDDEDDSAPTTTSRYSGSAAATAGAMLSSDASSGAKELLTRSVEESRARASRMDDFEEPKGPSQFSLLLQELIRLSPYIAAGMVGFVALFWFVNSMVSTSFPLPDLGYVKGRVTLDGQPLAGARITFAPTQKEFELPSGKIERIRTARAITDADGRYELIYLDDIEGTAIGPNHVVITKLESGREIVPAEHGSQSKVVKDVAAGSQEINFELKSPPAAPQEGPQSPGTRNRATTGR